jgi:hypothetical protein
VLVVSISSGTWVRDGVVTYNATLLGDGDPDGSTVKLLDNMRSGAKAEFPMMRPSMLLDGLNVGDIRWDVYRPDVATGYNLFLSCPLDVCLTTSDPGATIPKRIFDVTTNPASVDFQAMGACRADLHAEDSKTIAAKGEMFAREWSVNAGIDTPMVKVAGSGSKGWNTEYKSDSMESKRNYFFSAECKMLQVRRRYSLCFHPHFWLQMMAHVY